MSATVQEITSTDRMTRQANHGLMVRFINADLVVNANLDVRHSIVLYDEDKLFEAAVSPEVWDSLGDEVKERLRSAAGIHYWSVGIV